MRTLKKSALVLIALLLACSSMFVSCDLIDLSALNGTAAPADKEETEATPDMGDHDHIFNEKGKCTLCNEQTHITQDLDYELSSDRKSYILRGMGKASDREIFVPDVYKNKPVTAIAHSAFSGRGELISIKLPRMLTSIGDMAFADCRGLKQIDIPDTVVSIGKLAFSNCEQLIELTDGVEYIGKWAVNARYVNDYVQIRSGTVGIANHAFASRENVRNIDLPQGLMFIGSAAFMDCYGLENITLPESIVAIAELAFDSCPQLKQILFNGSFTQWQKLLENKNIVEMFSRYNIVFGKNDGEDTPILPGIEYPDTEYPGIDIPSEDDKWTPTYPSIGSHMCTYDEYGSCVYCGNTIYVTSGLEYTYDTYTQEYTVTGIGSATYEKNLVIPGMYNGKPVTKIGDYCFEMFSYLESVEMTYGIKSIGKNAFGYCDRLQSIKFPETLEVIDYGAFVYCSKLRDVNIQYEVTTIAEFAFGYCSNLESIYIPNSVKSLGFNVLFACNNLNTINYGGGTISKWIRLIQGNDWVEYCGDFTVYCSDGAYDKYGNKIESVTPDINYPSVDDSYTGGIVNPGDSSTTLNKYQDVVNGVTFTYSPLYAYGGYAITEISNYAYKDVKIPSSYNGIAITAIMANVFAEGEESPYSIYIPASITEIDVKAFRNFYHNWLQYIDVDAANTRYTVRDNCLYDTSNDTLLLGCNDASIYFLDADTIGMGAFYGCDMLQQIDLEITTRIEDRAFSNCTNLQTAHCYMAEYIGDYAFAECSNLQIAKISKATHVGRDAFMGCELLYRTDANCPEITRASSWIVDCDTSVEYANISTSTRIASYAFENCDMLHDVYAPRLQIIDEYAFNNCYSLNNVESPEGIKQINSYAFNNCHSLYRVNVGNLLQKIDAFAFNGCYNLYDITYTGTIDEWNAVEKADGWNANCGEFNINCSDGTVDKYGNIIYQY